MSWRDDLQPASLNGVRFGVLGDESRFGRRTALHEYPKRDKPYAEDMGRATRRMTISGFLIENSFVYGGGAVLAQRDALVAAAERPGPATLVHPTLGQLTVNLVEDGLTCAERWDEGRVIEIRLSMIEAGERVFPSGTIASTSLLGSLSAALGLGAAQNFITSMTEDVNLGLGAVHGVISLGQSVVSTVVDMVAQVNTLAGQAARDATTLFSLGSLLTGNLGRYVNANVTSAFAPNRQSVAVGWTMPALIAAGAEGRASVQAAGGALTEAAAGLDAPTVPTFPNAVGGLVNALAAILPNPGDTIARLGPLAAYPAPVIGGGGQVAEASNLAGAATAALVRRLTLGAIGQAAASYAPSSYDDAAHVRTVITTAIDAEITVAGDNGDDASFSALTNLREGVVQALALSGATLAPLRWVVLNANYPALAVAQRLYQDASRADQLIVQANPVHPAFMPARFQALAN